MIEGMPPPLIALTSRTVLLRATSRDRLTETLPRPYVDEIVRAGGLPVLVPNLDDAAPAEEFLERVDGLLLTGGDDVDPALFHEPPHPGIEKVDGRRDRFEIALARAAFDRAIPVFGVCRGIQLLNIAFGGDIYQDLVTQAEAPIGHAQRTIGDGPWHEVKIEPNTRLAAVAGDEPWSVNSYHHQACRRIGKGLVVSAVSADGLVEAIEGEGPGYLLGVQWHPEISAAAGDDRSRRLFESFVKAARERAAAASK